MNSKLLLSATPKEWEDQITSLLNNLDDGDNYTIKYHLASKASVIENILNLSAKNEEYLSMSTIIFKEVFTNLVNSLLWSIDKNYLSSDIGSKVSFVTDVCATFLKNELLNVPDYLWKINEIILQDNNNIDSDVFENISHDYLHYIHFMLKKNKDQYLNCKARVHQVIQHILSKSTQKGNRALALFLYHNISDDIESFLMEIYNDKEIRTWIFQYYLAKLRDGHVFDDQKDRDTSYMIEFASTYPKEFLFELKRFDFSIDLDKKCITHWKNILLLSDELSVKMKKILDSSQKSLE